MDKWASGLSAAFLEVYNVSGVDFVQLSFHFRMNRRNIDNI